MFIPSSLEHQGVEATFAELVTMMYGCKVLIFSILLRRITKNLKLSVYIAIGSYTGALASLLMMLSKNLLTSLTACILLGIAAATMHSSIQTWSTEVFPVLRSLASSQVFSHFSVRCIPFLGRFSFQSIQWLSRGSIEIFMALWPITSTFLDNCNFWSWFSKEARTTDYIA